MINIPIKHYEHEDDGKKYIISVFQFHVRTEYDDDKNTDDVKQFNVDRITKMIESAKKSDETRTTD